MHVMGRWGRAAALAVVLGACGGASEVEREAADEGPVANRPTASDAAADAAEGTQAGSAVTCDTFADHLLETTTAEAIAAGDNAMMTVDQQIAFAKAVVDGIRAGCKADDRLSEFPEQTACRMAATSRAEMDACDAQPKAAAFEAYMQGLVAHGLRGDHDGDAE